MARLIAKVKRPVGAKTMVLGLPNRGMVGVLCASYLLEKLGMKLLGEVAFFCLKPAVFTDEAGVTVRNTADVYSLKKAPGVVVFHCGDQPDPTEGWEMGRQILELAKGWGVKRVITAGAMPLPEAKVKAMAAGKTADARGCEVAASSAKFIEQAVRAGARPCKGSTDLVIVGLEGFIPGIAPWYGMDGGILLAETPYFENEQSLAPAASTHDMVATLAALRVLDSMLGLGLDLSDAEKRSREMDALQAKMLKQAGWRGPDTPAGYG